MQRGECTVFNVSVNARSYKAQKSDLYGLTMAKILFFLCVSYILSSGGLHRISDVGWRCSLQEAGPDDL